MKWVLIGLGALLVWALCSGRKKKDCGCHSANSDDSMTSGPLGSPGDKLGTAQAQSIPGQCLNRVSCG